MGKHDKQSLSSELPTRTVNATTYREQRSLPSLMCSALDQRFVSSSNNPTRQERESPKFCIWDDLELKDEQYAQGHIANK